LVDLAFLQSVSYIAGALGVCVAVVYYIMSLRTQVDNRKAQLFQQLIMPYLSNDWQKEAAELLAMQWTDFDDFARQYDSSINPDNWAKRAKHWTFLENIGYAVKKGLIDADMAYYELGGFYVLWMWNKFGPVITQYRTTINLPDWYMHFEFLAKELGKRHPLVIRETYGGYEPK
jgi:hypothetical protein